MFNAVAVRPETHELAKNEANRRGVKLCDFLGQAVQHYATSPPDPLGQFLRAVLDVCYSDHFEVGLNGWEIAETAFAGLPPEVKQLIHSATPIGEGRLKVDVVSKQWALETAAKVVLRQ